MKVELDGRKTTGTYEVAAPPKRQKGGYFPTGKEKTALQQN